MKIVSLEEAVQRLREGGLVLYPTETCYGLGAAVSRDSAVEKVYALKGREAGKPVSILVGAVDWIPEWVEDFSARARRLVRAFFPGPLTLVLPAASRVSSSLHGGSGWIGLRQSSHPLAQALVAAFGEPITTTSANPSGEVGASSVEDLRNYFRDADCGALLAPQPLAPSPGSTVVRVRGERLELLREGKIPFSSILEVL